MTIATRRKYNASRGGHAPGHLREAFDHFVENGEMPDADHWFDGKPRTIEWLIGQLWNCTDYAGGGGFRDPDGSVYGTYGTAARALKRDADLYR